jgi:hypothetical protein
MCQDLEEASDVLPGDVTSSKRGGPAPGPGGGEASTTA